jgi:hypothetical protein
MAAVMGLRVVLLLHGDRLHHAELIWPAGKLRTLTDAYGQDLRQALPGTTDGCSSCWPSSSSISRGWSTTTLASSCSSWTS